MYQSKLLEELKITDTEEMLGKTYSFVYTNGTETVATITHINKDQQKVELNDGNSWVVLENEPSTNGKLTIPGLLSVKEITQGCLPLTVNYVGTKVVALTGLKRIEDAEIKFGDSVILEFSSFKPYLIIAISKVDKTNINIIHDELWQVIHSGAEKADLYRMLIKGE